ncbi:hypothetical protein [Labrys wisconsinensis]|uniref:Uncharacterized protein n=1 Tax=Labrys wisconsinensis TaxID=425677 RepID=A0ABU0IYY6_9HYPH|nr:hypothetical protein [Labrys wisconsinensis]MDQ0467229.1 hypothetical protein [Labrys wisconsinensis]
MIQMGSVLRAFSAAMATGLALAASLGDASAASDDPGSVLTHVCQVDITYKSKSGDLVTATSCIDARYSCNDTPGVGVCAPGKSKSIVSKTCNWVALSMCQSQ